MVTLVIGLICLIFLLILILSANPEYLDFTIKFLLKCLRGINSTFLLWVSNIFKIPHIYCDGDDEELTVESLNKKIQELPDNLAEREAISQQREDYLNDLNEQINDFTKRKQIKKKDVEIYYKAAIAKADQLEDDLLESLLYPKKD